MRTIDAGSLDKIGASTLAAIYGSSADSLFRTNMIVSASGSFIDDNGSSRELSGAEDMRIFNFLRSQSDVVLVGASTARSEKYGQITIRDEFVETARSTQPRVAVVSASLDLWTGARLFNEIGPQPLVFTRESSDSQWSDRRDALQSVAEVVVLAPQDHEFLPKIRTELTQRELTHILCEGGPKLLTATLEANLVDDVCLTYSHVSSKRAPDTELLTALESFERQYEIVTDQFTFTRGFDPQSA